MLDEVVVLASDGVESPWSWVPFAPCVALAGVSVALAWPTPVEFIVVL